MIEVLEMGAWANRLPKTASLRVFIGELAPSKTRAADVFLYPVSPAPTPRQKIHAIITQSYENINCVGSALPDYQWRGDF